MTCLNFVLADRIGSLVEHVSLRANIKMRMTGNNETHKKCLTELACFLFIIVHFYSLISVVIVTLDYVCIYSFKLCQIHL